MVEEVMEVAAMVVAMVVAPEGAHDRTSKDNWY